MDLTKIPYIGEIVHYFVRPYQIAPAIVLEVFPLEEGQEYPYVSLYVLSSAKRLFFAVDGVPHYLQAENKKRCWCFKGQFVPDLTGTSAEHVNDENRIGTQASRFHNLIER